MGKVIKFPRLTPGEIFTTEVKGVPTQLQVIKHIGDNLYRVKALDGKYKGYYGDFKLTELEGKKV